MLGFLFFARHVGLLDLHSGLGCALSVGVALVSV